MRCAWAAPPRCMLRGPRAHQGVNAHVQGFACEQHATTEPVGAHNVDHLAHNSPLSPVFAEVVCTVGTTPPHVGSSPPPVGGNCTIRRTTRRRHADSQRLMLQNPHRHRCAERRWARARPRCPRGNRGERQISFARNLTRSFFEMAHKRCNSNGRISKSEICGGELRATLVTGGHD